MGHGIPLGGTGLLLLGDGGDGAGEQPDLVADLVHRLGPGVPGSLHVVDDVHLGGDPAVIKRLLEKRKESRELVRFVLGYSGWGAAQLEAEIAEGAWVVSPASEDLVFDARPDSLWRRALRRLGGPWAALADEPPDPSWN